MVPCKQTASPKIFIISLFFRTFKNALQNILVQHDLFNDIRNFMKFEPLFASLAQKIFFSKNIGKVFSGKLRTAVNFQTEQLFSLLLLLFVTLVLHM